MTKIDDLLTTITPDFAAQLLSRNTRNRPLSKKLVDDYAKILRSGNFLINGDPIRVDLNGVLLDGQHRLSACVSTGIPIQAVFVEGLPPKVMSTIDQHSKRTIGQVLAIEGHKNANHLAALVRMTYGIATGQRFSVRLSSSDVIKFIERHPAVIQSASLTTVIFPKTSTIVGAIHYIGVFNGHSEHAAEFVRGFKNGIPKYDGDPIHAVRERLLRDSRITPSDRVKLCVNGWNKFILGERSTLAKIPIDPRIIGWDLESFEGTGPET